MNGGHSILELRKLEWQVEGIWLSRFIYDFGAQCVRRDREHAVSLAIDGVRPFFGRTDRYRLF